MHLDCHEQYFVPIPLLTPFTSGQWFILLLGVSYWSCCALTKAMMKMNTDVNWRWRLWKQRKVSCRGPLFSPTVVSFLTNLHSLKEDILCLDRSLNKAWCKTQTHLLKLRSKMYTKYAFFLAIKFPNKTRALTERVFKLIFAN